jgi:hypothetical protein
VRADDRICAVSMRPSPMASLHSDCAHSYFRGWDSVGEKKKVHIWHDAHTHTYIHTHSQSSKKKAPACLVVAQPRCLCSATSSFTPPHARTPSHRSSCAHAGCTRTHASFRNYRCPRVSGNLCGDRLDPRPPRPSNTRHAR